MAIPGQGPDTEKLQQAARGAGRARWIWVAGVLAAGLVLSAVLFQVLRRAESRQIDLDFRRDASDLVSAVRVSLIHGLDAVTALDSLYASTPEVDREAFRAFTRSYLGEEPGVVFLGWAPRVDHRELEAFERSVRQERPDDPELAATLARFRLFDAGAEGPVPAADRQEHFPVLYAEPAATLHTIGLDLASEPVQLEALLRAAANDARAVSRRDSIRPNEPDRFGVSVFDPVYVASPGAGNPSRSLRGFLIGMFEVGAAVERALATLEPRGVDLVIHDRSADPAESLLYHRPARPEAAAGQPWVPEDGLGPRRLEVVETVPVGDRQWLIGCRPAAGYVAARRTGAPLAALLGGLLLSACLAAVLSMRLHREAEARSYARQLLGTKEVLERQAEERERAADRLRQAQEMQRRILDSLPLNVFLKDTEGRVRFCNAQGLRFLGRERDEVVGKTDFDLFPAHVAEELRRVDRRVLEEGEHSAQERLEVDGRVFHYLTGKTAIEVDGSSEPYLLGFSIDMTEIREAQEALAESEYRFRQLVENMSSGVAVYQAVDDGADFLFRDYNRAAERMDGLARTEVLERRLTEVFPGAEEMGMLETLRRVWRTGEPLELPSTLYRDERFTAWRENYVYRLPTGEVVAIYDDVSERKRLEAELLHAQKMEAIGRLAGGVAHDFNNLLQVVAGNCELLLDSSFDEAERREMLSEIHEQAERGTGLVRRLLVFSRREAHAPAPLDLSEMVRGLETLVRRLVRENIDLRIDLTDEPLPISGDAGQLEQALMNLVVNAADAMPEGGRMTIRTGAGEAREVWLSVRDTGPGIDAAIVDRVFDPYFTTKSAAQGTGLGLAVVDGIVSLHQGRVEIDNRPGRGVEFKVILPRDDETPPAPRNAPERAARPTGGGERVLFIEDQDLVRKTVQAMLESLGYRVTTATDGAAARQRAAETRFDLLVSDIVLPDTNGIELAEELRRTHPELAVLLVSGYAESSLRDQAAGIRFLQKPFRVDDLAREVAAALRHEPPAAG